MVQEVAQCTHYWIIESVPTDKHIFNGECRLCGAMGEFPVIEVYKQGYANQASSSRGGKIGGVNRNKKGRFARGGKLNVR